MKARKNFDNRISDNRLTSLFTSNHRTAEVQKPWKTVTKGHLR